MLEQGAIVKIRNLCSLSHVDIILVCHHDFNR